MDGERAGRLLVLYDADCGFCTTSARALTSPWLRSEADARPFQAVAVERFGLTVDKCAEKLHVVDGSRVFVGGRAVAAVLRRSRFPWPAVSWVMTLPGISWVVERVYALVARNRHRLPGGSAACEMPPRVDEPDTRGDAAG
ncbi:MAG: DUF393 domain-containing protein [Arachnia sp.]